MNGDGRMDLFVANHDTDHLTLLTGDGKGGFTAREIKVPSKPHPHMVAAADIDHDGKMELITDSWMKPIADRAYRWSIDTGRCRS